MKYVRLRSTDPYLNLATEEYLFRHSDDDIFMLWQNRPSVIIGKNQNAYAEVNVESAAERQISVVRRITGGGAVFHDLGNLNYTFITSSDKAESLDFAYFTKPIIDALGSLGLSAELSGRNDILCEGRKISGNAHFSDGRRILHHGTLLFDADLNAMSTVLRSDIDKLRMRAIKSHKGRVANIKELLGGGLTVEDFIAHIEGHLAPSISGVLSLPEDDSRLTGLYERNRSDEWIFSHKSFLREYAVSTKMRFDFGTVALELSLNGDRVERAVISGDFFEVRPVSELEALMAGRTLAEIERIDPSLFIGGMATADLSLLISHQ